MMLRNSINDSSKWREAIYLISFLLTIDYKLKKKPLHLPISITSKSNNKAINYNITMLRTSSYPQPNLKHEIFA